MINGNNEQDIIHVYNGITEYCRRYNIPKESLLDILEDQKVLPMIRGKATEYVGAAFLKQALETREWSVEKLNLNPQQSVFDEDVSVTFRRTGSRLKVETKTAGRGSFKMASRSIEGPHIKVKCHRSRSNLKRQSATNDRYLVGEFDLLLSNISNAIFRGKSLDSGMALIDDPAGIAWLKEFYKVSSDEELIRSAYDDWRICLPFTIADEAGVIPRNPVVLLKDDLNWFGPDKLAANLRSLINGKSSGR